MKPLSRLNKVPRNSSRWGQVSQKCKQSFNWSFSEKWKQSDLHPTETYEAQSVAEIIHV